MPEMKHVPIFSLCLTLALLGMSASAQVVVKAPVLAPEATASRAVASATNETQRLEQERGTLTRQLDELQQKAIVNRQQMIQQNATLASRKKRIDALSAELETLKQEQHQELQAIDAASGSTMPAEFARLTARLQAVNQALSSRAPAVESAHP